jgi:putative phosphoesterase
MPEKTTVIGVISDTHMPARCRRLPDAVFDVFADVDLILHAGDLGALWVLDELSQIAPIIAVHGNDETSESTKSLPYLQTLSVAGHRIVLTHSHYPDRAVEMEKRKDDRWQPKLTRIAEFGRQNGAEIVIYGHSHIPMSYVHEGIHLINPGAIASGSGISRQAVKSVARMTVWKGEPIKVEHIDLSNPNEPFTPPFDIEAGFKKTIAPYTAFIVEPALRDHFDWFVKHVYPLDADLLWSVFAPTAHQRWEGDESLITLEEFVAVYRDNPKIPANILAKMGECEAFAVYL